MNNMVLGEHYNARGLSPEMVAKTFVPPPQFDIVAAPSNSVLVGPRGSGKTTLLRMLDPRAVTSWQADQGRNKVSYIGIFVPVDVAWVSSLVNTLGPDHGEDAHLAHLAVYTLAVARALIDVMRWRGSEGTHDEFRVSMSLEQEITLAQALSEIFFNERRAKTLLELRLLISRELVALPRSWRRGDSQLREGLVSGLANPLASAASACDSFNVIFEQHDRKWAILCDELELAPKAVQQMLFSGLRAAPSPLILKYSITPRRQLPLGDEADRPLPANDFDVIPLTYATREEGIPERDRAKFCAALWRSIVLERAPDVAEALENPFKVLVGLSNQNFLSSTDEASDGLDRNFGGIFRSLAQKDASFANFMAKKGVDLSNLDLVSQSLKDSVVRKVRPLVEIRDHHFGESDGVSRRKGRKSYAPYCGARRVFAVSEGHPRWLKYTLGSMIDGLNDKGKIRVPEQSREIERSIHRIEARVRALPSSNLSTYQVIDLVGRYFQSQVLGREFTADPYLSFIVDDDVPGEVVGCLEQALYIGVVIPMQVDIATVFTNGLMGKRFRLSNWLAPLYKLPLITGKVAKLSTIVSSGSLSSPLVGKQYSLELNG